MGHTAFLVLWVSTRLIGGHADKLSEHVSDLALLISKEQAIGYCRYYDNHHLEVVKGFFLNSTFKEWGMTYHQASARFLLDRIPLIDQRRSVQAWRDLSR